MQLLLMWFEKFFVWLGSQPKRIKKLFFNPGQDTLLAEYLKCLTDKDDLVWEKKISDISANYVEYNSKDKEDREFVVAEGKDKSVVIFIRVGHVLSQMTKVRNKAALDLYKSIEKQQERTELDKEFEQLMNDYK